MAKETKLICIRNEYQITTYSKRINPDYRSGTDTYTVQKWKNVNSFFEQLETLIRNNQADQLQKLMMEDYIFEEKGFVEKETSNYDDSIGRSEKHNYTYLSCVARPCIEVLALDKPNFCKILDLAKAHDDRHNTNMRWCILQALRRIRLAPNESIDFSDMNLSRADFSGAQLSSSDFTNTKTNHAVFYNCDLAKTNITQGQLDQSYNYERARVPKDCWGYWDNTLLAKLRIYLTELKAHADSGIAASDPKFEFIQDFYNNCRFIVYKQSINSQDKQNLFNYVLEAKNSQVLAKHNHYYFLIGEIMTCILTAGLPYLVLASLNYHRTGHFGLFACPTSQKKAIQMYEALEEQQVPSQAL